MFAPILIAVVVVAVVALLVFARRDRSRRIGFEAESPAAGRKSTQWRIGAHAAGSRAVESRDTAGSRAVESAPAARPGRATRAQRPPSASPPWGAAPPAAAAALSPEDLAEVLQALSGGQKIMAIKLVRERTGLGLKEAKDFVERL